MSTVPVVNIADPTSTSLEALDAACRDHGFFLLGGHGLDDLIARTWEVTERFFDSPYELRDGVRRDAAIPFGYNDRELTKRYRDHKQVFDFGCPADERMASINRWPDGLDGFRSTLEAFHAAFGDLAHKTCALLHATLGLTTAVPQTIRGDEHRSTVRLNHYPVGDPVPVEERSGLAELGPTALGYHTDPGVLTLLLQDLTGGLQTRTRRDEWIDVEPRDGTIVVNLADAVQVWTNDRYQAAVHRVAPMTTKRRFSIPFFFNPVAGAMVEPIPELCDTGPRYQSFRWSDFMQSRNADNYADIGGEDAQISDYLLT